MRRSWSQRKGLVAWLVLGGFTALVLLASVFGEQGMLKIRQLTRERVELEDKIVSLESEITSLRRQVRIMQTDTFPYEKAARERLGLAKPGEVVYDFRPDPLERTR